jgi:hypothetical protein
MARKTTKKVRTQDDPTQTLVIIGDDGKVYKLLGSEWKKHPVVSSEQIGVIEQLKEFGTYLAYLPPDIAVGLGTLCMVVNLEAILKNNAQNPKAVTKATQRTRRLVKKSGTRTKRAVR